VPKVVSLAVEDFDKYHPAMNSILVVEAARVALAKYHVSPASFQLHQGAKTDPAIIHFKNPDPRSRETLEREDIVEKGAIVMAGLHLAHSERKQITRVVPRGGRIDYFVGERAEDFRWILEVSGTDSGNLESLRGRKREQLQDSYYRKPPHWKDGFVSVTRFAPAAATVLDAVAAAF
jgi:hypothetical protein